MALLIAINYRNKPLTYSVTNTAEEIYLLRMQAGQEAGGDFLPEKIVIRRKGKIWVSDADNCPELIHLLTAEIATFKTKNKAA